MTLRLRGGPSSADLSLTDNETGADVLRSVRASELRLVIGPTAPPRIEFAPSVEFDYEVPGAARCFIGCPETGERREVAEIVFTDGGRISFPRDFSSAAGAEQVEEALPGAMSSDQADLPEDPEVLRLLRLLDEPRVRRKLTRISQDHLRRSG